MFVNDQLMPEEVEVDPVFAGTPLFKAKDLTVEMPRSGEVIDRNCQVKRCECHQVKPLWVLSAPSLALLLTMKRR